MARLELAEHAMRAIGQLRDARRFRQVQKQTVKALRQLTSSMASSAMAGVNPRDREAWRRLDILTRNLDSELRAPAADQLDAAAEVLERVVSAARQFSIVARRKKA